MNSIVLLLFFLGACYCEVDFSDRPRNFSIELLYHTQLQTGGHVVISPFGIWTLMTGVAIGATGNSYAELSRAFILPKKTDSLIKGYKDLTNAVLSSSSSGVSLISKNFVFLDNDFIVYPAFRNTIQRDFGATVKILDFDDPNSVRTANTYIENSGGRVSNVLRSDDFKESRMIVTNVISFKGLWSLPFNKSDTVIEPFYSEQKEVVGNVNMMYQKGEFPLSNIPSINALVLELPYGSDGKYSMLLLLPYPNVRVNDMYKHFTTVAIKDIFAKLQEDVDSFGLEEVDVKLPRFHISTNVVLNSPLNDMGVFDIFQPDAASFGRVTTEDIFVSAIIHKADIEVTESGTVASASTSATFADRISTPTFHANRPFVYFIMEKSTTTVIFAGIYSKPTVY